MSVASPQESAVRRQETGEIWSVPPIFPLEVAGDRVDRLHVLVGVRHVQCGR